MKIFDFDIIKYKIDKITDIWNHFILEYRFCSSKIKFTEDVQTNYFGDIVGYFNDTITIVLKHYHMENDDDNFSSAICFLQSIYVQQDFIEELLSMFRCNTSKGDLKNDRNYSINREIRNELIGHPISKHISKNKAQIVLSSTLFHFRESEKNNIAYLRYHQENNYAQELIVVSKEEMLERHINFLNIYLDIIISKLLKILDLFNDHIKKIEKNVSRLNFDRIVAITYKSYEYIYTTNRLYSPKELKLIWGKRNEHLRYQNFIDSYYTTLKTSLKESKMEIKNYKKKLPKRIIKRELPEITIVFEDTTGPSKIKHKITYNYELSKLSEIRPIEDFNFFASLLQSKCEDMPDVLTELKFMSASLNNEIDYYCSFNLIAKWLKF